MAGAFYRSFYRTGGVIEDPFAERLSSPRLDLDTRIAELIRVTNRPGYWDGGWQRVGLDDRQVIVEGADMRLWVSPRDLQVDGDRWSVRMPGVFPLMSPGFFVINGAECMPLTIEPDALMRLYVNVSEISGMAFIGAFGRRLDAAGVQFQAKILVDPLHYDRCDTLVVYLPERFISPALSVLGALLADARDTLRSLIPAMTHRVAPGVAIADGLVAGESFGQTVCRRIAEALWRCARETSEDAMTALRAVFDKEGGALEVPYSRNPERASLFSRLSQEWRVVRSPRRTVGGRGAPSIREAAPPFQADPLSWALDAAEVLAESAVWSGRRCTWLARARSRDDKLEWRSVGSNLYTGNAGVAHFLTAVHEVTGDSEWLDVAAGAAWGALDHADADESDDLGLFSGLAGVAAMATRISTLRDDHEMRSRADGLWDRIARGVNETVEFDAMSGLAGVMLATASEPEPRKRILVRCLDRLGRIARRRRGRAVWYAPRGARRPLTGLAHGSAGVLLAHAVAHDTCDIGLAPDLVDDVLAYDSECFDAQHRNWADFRFREPGRRAAGTVAWCHGAPGIVLARAVSYKFLGDPKLLDRHFEAGVGRVVDSVGSARHETFEPCLCHGLAGNLDVLLTLTRIVPDLVRPDSLRSSIGSLLSVEAAKLVRSQPGLMLGAAGVGLMALRLASPSVRSVLALGAP